MPVKPTKIPFSQCNPVSHRAAPNLCVWGLMCAFLCSPTSRTLSNEQSPFPLAISDISTLCLQPSPVATLATPPMASPRAPSSTSTMWPNSSATPASAWRELPNPSAWPMVSGAAPCPPAEVSLGFLWDWNPWEPPRGCCKSHGSNLGVSPRRSEVLEVGGTPGNLGSDPLEQLFLHHHSFGQSPLPFFPWDQHSGSLPKSPSLPALPPSAFP